MTLPPREKFSLLGSLSDGSNTPHSVFSGLGLGLGRCSTSTRITVPATIGGWSWSAQRPRHPSLGCSPVQLLTCTLPWRVSWTDSSAVGTGALSGSDRANRVPWRRGLPSVPAAGWLGSV